MPNAYINGVGHYVPERVITNDDLAKIMDTSDEWITERSGIKERRFADLNVDSCSNMAFEASQLAIERSGLTAQDIDFIVFATLSPDYDFPGAGVLLQRKLGIPGIGALDVRNQCSGFVYAISVADNFIKSGMYKNILVVGSELQSSGLDLSTRGRDIAVLFGDGAGAAVLSATDEDKGVLSTHLHADGTYAEDLALIYPGSNNFPRVTHEMVDNAMFYPYMNGREVFKHAATRFPEVIMEALNHNHLTPDNLALVIPHQANLRIIKHVQKTLGLPDEKVFSNIQKYGNTTAASVVIALSEAIQENKIKTGDYVCLAAFGSGFTWASAMIKF